VPPKLVVKPKSNLITITKGDDRCVCEQDQLETFEKNGWKLVAAQKEQARAEVLHATIDPRLVMLAKGDKRCACEEAQVAAFEAGGWSRVVDTEKSSKPDSEPDSKPKQRLKVGEKDKQ